MGKWRTKLYKTDRARDFDHERDRQVRARQVYETIDRQPFQWIVTVVAGIGFFLDGYTLFASNVAMPMIAYVYWNNEVSDDKLMWINIATLAGTILGQVLFGVLADQKGRKKMYGMELVVLIVSTLGVAMASTGTHNSMSVFSWLLFWRVTAGIGVGADYPLSAVITSEFAPTAQRARMLATVFFMQPLGQIASNLVAMVVITITRKSRGEEDLVRSVDIMWRWIIGIGIFPGILAILFRVAIPETPRFMLEIEDDPIKAEYDATHLFGDTGDDEELVSPTSKELETGTWMLDTNDNLHTSMQVRRPMPSLHSKPSTSHTFYYDDEEDIDNQSAFANADWTLTKTALPTLNSKWSLTRRDIYQYFIKEKNYITLLGTSLSWLLLDFGFYGIGLSSPHFLSKTWGNLNIHGERPPWQTTDDPNVSIYDTFLGNSIHALVILNAGSFVGGLLLILTINRLNRVTLQRWGFLFLAAIFVAMGTTFLTSSYREGSSAIGLYVIAQVAFNFGPNATTFILPSELFPTRYRASCHGISAASGKLGSILMQVVSKGIATSGPHLSGQAGTDERAQRDAHMLVGYSVVMIVGCLVSFWIPEVQEREQKKEEDKNATRWQRVTASIGRVTGSDLRSRTLEELSLGRMGNRSEVVSREQRETWI